MKPTKTQAYSVQEVAALLGIAPSTLYDHVRAGKVAHLHPITVGTRTVFPKKVIDALLNPAVSA